MADSMLSRMLAECQKDALFFRQAAPDLDWDGDIEKSLNEAMRRSGIIDEERYLADYPDVAELEMGACSHFITFGFEEGRSIFNKNGEKLFAKMGKNFKKEMFWGTKEDMDANLPHLLFICMPDDIENALVTIHSCLRNLLSPCVCFIIASRSSLIASRLRLPEGKWRYCAVYEPLSGSGFMDWLDAAYEILPGSCRALYIASGCLACDDISPLSEKGGQYLNILAEDRNGVPLCVVINTSLADQAMWRNPILERLVCLEDAAAIQCDPQNAAGGGHNRIKLLLNTSSELYSMLWRREQRLFEYAGQREASLRQTPEELLAEFMNFQVRSKSVLIVETMECHGELIPGVALFFLRRGWHVDVLTRTDNYSAFPLCRITDSGINYFHNNADQLGAMLNIGKLNSYFLIVFTSKIIYTRSPQIPDPGVYDWPTIYDNWPQLTHLRHKIFTFQHHLERVFEDGEDNSLVLANPMRVVSLENKIVNLCQFGEIELVAAKNKTATFICVGDIKPERRNHKLLLDTAEKVSTIYKNFKIIVIARYGNFDFPAKLDNFIEFHSNATFEELYASLEKADFILPMLDPRVKGHERYLRNGTSGTFQLIYGFHKPALIHKVFAPPYFLNDANSLVYEDDEGFFKVFLEAIAMPNARYAEIRKTLAVRSAAILAASEKNLQNYINRALDQEYD